MAQYTETAFSSCDDGKSVRAMLWVPEEKPLAVVQISHGLREHIGRYDKFARYMADRGVLVVGADHPGHGAGFTDPADRAVLRSWETAADDMKSLYDRIRRLCPEEPYFLLGHGEGCVLAGAAVLRGKMDVTGYIFSAPYFKGPRRAAMQTALSDLVIRTKGENWRSGILERLTGSTGNRKTARRTPYDWLSRDDSAVDSYEADGMCGGVVAAVSFREILRAADFCRREQASARAPGAILILGGENDAATAYGQDCARLAQLYMKAGAPHPTVRVYPGGRHEMLWETNKLEVFGDIFQWLRLNMPEKGFYAQETPPEEPEQEPEKEEEDIFSALPPEEIMTADFTAEEELLAAVAAEDKLPKAEEEEQVGDPQSDSK